MKMLEVKMTLVRSTKNTHVYSADVDPSLVNVIYMEKSKMPSPAPQHVTVTVEFDEK